MATAAVLTISDSRARGEADDLSGPVAEKLLTSMGLEITRRIIVPDDAASIRAEVQALVDQVPLIVTTGGTGIAHRDVTPEAVGPILEKTLPGFGEIMRTGSYEKTPLSIISRGGAGIAGRTLIVMMPGSPRAVRDGLTLLGPAIRHVLQFLQGPPADCRHETE